MAWQPDETQMRQLAGYLRDALDGRDQNAQKYATVVSHAQPTHKRSPWKDLLLTRMQ